MSDISFEVFNAIDRNVDKWKESKPSNHERYDNGISELPLTNKQKEVVLEYLAYKIWKEIELRVFKFDGGHKNYDPLTIDGNEAHSYVFGMDDDGRHHDYENLDDLEGQLIETIKGHLRTEKQWLETKDK